MIEGEGGGTVVPVAGQPPPGPTGVPAAGQPPPSPTVSAAGQPPPGGVSALNRIRAVLAQVQLSE